MEDTKEKCTFEIYRVIIPPANCVCGRVFCFHAETDVYLCVLNHGHLTLISMRFIP